MHINCTSAEAELVKAALRMIYFNIRLHTKKAAKPAFMYKLLSMSECQWIC